MALPQDKLEEIPEVYRDFLTVLKPVLDSKAPGVILRITAIPFGMIYNALSNKYAYDIEQVRRLAQNLRAQGFIEEDSLGFFTPTAKGEDLIQALNGMGGAVEKRVPPLPSI